MAVLRAVRRLFRVLEIEEEQKRQVLAAAQAELSQLRNSFAAARMRATGGRELIVSSAKTGDLPDRLAGLEETRAAQRSADFLEPRIANAETQVGALREMFLSKRVERRQAETLIHEAEAEDAIQADRRGQQSLDDWYLNNRLSGRSDRSTKQTPAKGDCPDDL